MHRSTLALALILAGLTAPHPASAQPRTVLVLPWSAGETDPAALAARAEAVGHALSSGELAALPLADARARFEAHGSSEPPSLTDAELDEWLALSRTAVRHLAQTDYARARASLLQAREVSGRATAELNREEAHARQVLDTCLYDVRAHVETHDPRAATQAMECRRLVPRISPSPYNHTPEVVALLAEIDRELAASPTGALHVSSDPSGCAVRLNGVPLGVTPFVSAEVASGEYAVQVECGSSARGRVHHARVGDGTSTIVVDPRFESVVRTDTALRLAYESESDAEERRLADAVRLGTALEAAEVWLLSLEAGDVVRLDRVVVASSTPLASIRANALAGIGDAVASLARARSEDRTGLDTVALARWRGAAAPDAAVHGAAWGRADWEVGVGVAAGVLALSAFATSLALADDGYRLGLASASYPLTDPLYLRSRDAWQTQRTLSWAFSAAGGVLGTLGVALAMEEEHGAPWWSWVIGGAGLAGVVSGVALVGTATECGSQRPVEGCVAGSQRLDLGVSAIGMSMPLLAVPVVFLVREVTHGGITPSVEVTGDGATVEVSGTW